MDEQGENEASERPETAPQETVDEPSGTAPLARSGRNKAVVAALAALVVIVVGGVAAVLLLKGSGSHELHVTIAATGPCSSAPKMQIFVVDSANRSASARNLKFTSSGSGCDLTFDASLEKADGYRIHISLSESGVGTATLSSPNYTSDQLASDGYDLTVPASDFAGGGSSASSSPVPGGAVSSADMLTESDLRNSMAVAKTYFTTGGTYSGASPKAFAQIDANLKFDTASTASVGTVSIRAVTATTILLVEKSASGTVFCIADDAKSGTTYGTTDATTMGACSDPAWPNGG